MSRRKYTNTEKNLIKKLKDTNDICYYCGCKLTEKTVDHKIPVKSGGKTTEDNLVVCCENCNREKGQLNEEQFNQYKEIVKQDAGMQYLNTLIKSFDEIFNNIEQDKENLKNLEEEIVELQNTIMSSNFSASDGYKLCRDLKNLLISKEAAKNKVEQSEAIYNLVKNDYNVILNKIKKIRNTIKQKSVLKNI